MTRPKETRGFWAWASLHADGLKAIAAIAITPIIAIVGWQIQASIADRANTAEVARADAAAQFEADQQRLSQEFEQSLEAMRSQRADQDRNAQYVALAINILTEPVADGDQLQGALRRYAVDILKATSPIVIPQAIADALADGTITVPVVFLESQSLNASSPQRFPDVDFASSIQEQLDRTRCSVTDRLSCLVDND